MGKWNAKPMAISQQNWNRMRYEVGFHWCLSRDMMSCNPSETSPENGFRLHDQPAMQSLAGQGQCNLVQLSSAHNLNASHRTIRRGKVLHVSFNLSHMGRHMLSHLGRVVIPTAQGNASQSRKVLNYASFASKGGALVVLRVGKCLLTTALAIVRSSATSLLAS
jgi:hypothetical protein